MKKNYRIVGLVLTGIIACGMCSCSNEKEQAATATVAPTAVAEKLSETVKTGVVIDASMNTLVIEAPDGTTYSFVTDDATEFTGESENLGDTVSVEFEGEYSENILAKKIKVDSKAETNVSAEAVEVKKEEKETKNEKIIKYITAEVKDASMNHMTVEWGGKEYNVLKDDKTSVEGNVQVGSTVRIYHEGDIADGMVAIDISVVDESIKDKNVRYITGKVVDASMNAISIENGGHTYRVLKDDNTKSDSVNVGDTVRIYHKGSYSDGMTAISIVKQ